MRVCRRRSIDLLNKCLCRKHTRNPLANLICYCTLTQSCSQYSFPTLYTSQIWQVDQADWSIVSRTLLVSSFSCSGLTCSWFHSLGFLANSRKTKYTRYNRQQISYGAFQPAEVLEEYSLKRLWTEVLWCTFVASLQNDPSQANRAILQKYDHNKLYYYGEVFLTWWDVHCHSEWQCWYYVRDMWRML